MTPGLSSSGEESTEALQKKAGTSPSPSLLRAEQWETSPDHSQKESQIPGGSHELTARGPVIGVSGDLLRLKQEKKQCWRSLGIQCHAGFEG